MPATSSMLLASAAFTSGAAIPRRFTCDGDGRAPPLNWSNAPLTTRSFALVCRDPDAPSGTFYHWAAFDVPPSQINLPEHRGLMALPIHEAINDFGRRGYGGPCPPKGHGAHHYLFTLYALEVDHIELTQNVRCREVERAAAARALATAELIGTYSRA